MDQSAVSQEAEVNWEDMSAVSQEDEVKLDKENKRLFPVISIHLLIGIFLLSKLFTYKADR